MTKQELWEAAEETIKTIVGKLIRGEPITNDEYVKLWKLNETHRETLRKYNFKQRGGNE